MLQMVKQISFIFTAILLCSCNHLDIKGMFVSSSVGVQTRFEQSIDMYPDLNAGVIEAQESYTFYVAADPHVKRLLVLYWEIVLT